MVEYSLKPVYNDVMTDILSSKLDLLFYALSDPTRRKILEMMSRGHMRTINELAAPFKMSLAAISKHVKVLERATLLIRAKQGRVHECTLNPNALKTAEACIQFYTKFWNESIDLFAESLEEQNGTKITKQKSKLSPNSKTKLKN